MTGPDGGDRRRAALLELLYQLADDDFLIAFRASEWLGLAPQIEEDVAFASIAQDEMGHAARYYGLLEELGEGGADDLAHGRPAAERRNSVLVEAANGPGGYLEDPRFDFAFTLARHFVYDLYESARLERLERSAHQPLADLAVKIRREERYHLLHHRTWAARLSAVGGETRGRLAAGLSRALALAGDLPSPGPLAGAAEELGLFPDPAGAEAQWRREVRALAELVGAPRDVPAAARDGRMGEHTPDLGQALAVLSEVYRLEPGARW